ncbi:ribose-phosphate pyrophosphokinase-like domain-containing protein [Ruminococcaceae bacterium OttesenSCG-928-O06]|nr:ribose-phosphate pyrophosphokinase-like domain-containing protein [Ruminococcaceae bacterium OttesenSCG-928-O06]
MAFDVETKPGQLRESIRPLALLPMRGCEELGERVNQYLLKWTVNPEDERLFTFPGYDKNSFLISAECPRFGTGEGKGMIRHSVRGYDLYILCDVTNYRVSYPMYDLQCPMSPDDHFADLKRLIAAAGNKPYRITVIMPYLYEGRQHRKAGRESLDCAIALQELYNLGVHNILTFDAHDPRVANAAPMANFDNIAPTYQILKCLLHCCPDIVIDREHTMVISPDEGAADRNIYFASVMGLLNILEGERTRLKRTMDQASTTSINVRDVALPGVEIIIDTRSMKILEPMRRVKFRRVQESIEAIIAGK